MSRISLVLLLILGLTCALKHVRAAPAPTLAPPTAVDDVSDEDTVECDCADEVPDESAAPPFVTVAGTFSHNALAAGEPTFVVFGGGKAPYSVGYTTTENETLVELADTTCGEDQRVVRWATYIPEGTNVTFHVNDSSEYTSPSSSSWYIVGGFLGLGHILDTFDDNGMLLHAGRASIQSS